MKHLCAYLLRMGGFRELTADDIHRVLASVDLQADDCEWSDGSLQSRGIPE